MWRAVLPYHNFIIESARCYYGGFDSNYVFHHKLLFQQFRRQYIFRMSNFEFRIRMFSFSLVTAFVIYYKILLWLCLSWELDHMDNLKTAPLLTVQVGTKTCLFCQCDIKSKEISTNVSANALEKLQETGGFAEKWSKTSPTSAYAKNFELVWEKIKSINTNNSTNSSWPAHAACRRNFLNETKLQTNMKATAEKMTTRETENQENQGTDVAEEKPAIRRSSRGCVSIENCFVCEKGDVRFSKKGETHRESLSRCELDCSEEKLLEAMERNLKCEDLELVAAANRLKVFTSITDAHATDLQYHQRCYNRFLRGYEPKNRDKDEQDIVRAVVERKFFELLRCQVIYQKSCFLLKDLMLEINEMYEKYDCKARFTRTNSFSDLVTQKFKEVKVTPALGLHGSPLVIHASDINPADYALASRIGAGLRDADITISFARMINRKIKASKEKMEFPVSVDPLIKQLNSHNPLKEIFNAISYSIDPKWQENLFGYAIPASEPRALKIWCIADAWQRLVVGGESPHSISLSMVVHRLTGCKETINLLNHAGFGISYTNVCRERKKLSQDARSDNSIAPTSIPKGQATHVTLDNSDGKQQTLTGVATTHHTNSTIYVPKLTTYQNELPNVESSMDIAEEEVSIDIPVRIENSRVTTSKEHLFREREDGTKGFKIGTKPEPPALKDSTIQYEKNWLDERLNCDLAWCLAANFTDDDIEMPPIGSWTVFNSMTTNTHTVQSDLDYFPVIPYPPKDSILKDYMDFLVDLKEDLEIQNIFCHSDQDVFYKMSQIIWKEESKKYEGIINIMGSFHILLVNLKVLYKKYALLGLRDWWVKSKIIADGSVDKALEGRHYSRGTRLHKQAFEALLRFKCNTIEKDFDPDFVGLIKKLRENPTHANLVALCSHEKFRLVKENIMAYTGTMGEWISEYIRDVSKFLSRIAAYRDKNIELHLQAQEELLPLLFAFNHQNYARYLTYHHYELKSLEANNASAYEQLKTYGMGASLSGKKFSTIPGDLVTEVTVNREVKVRGGPMRGGYSTSGEAVDDFVLNTHSIAKLRRALKNKMNIKTSNAHKEFSHGQIKLHEQQITCLISNIQTDPFHGCARNIISGLEVNPKVVKSLLGSTNIGETQKQEFVRDRVLSRKTSFHDPIKKSSVSYKEVKNKKPKAVSVLKEDRQALGLFVSKFTDKRVAFHHPLTTYPLAIADPEGTLYQPTTKSTFRNLLITFADESIEKNPPQHAVHIYDGMATVRSVQPQKTWGDLWRVLLKCYTPNEAHMPSKVHIVFDNYTDNAQFSVKQTKRKSRAGGVEGKRVYIGTDSQEMPQGDDYKDFLKNSSNKGDLIRRFGEFVQREVPRLDFHYPMVVTIEKNTWEITSAGVSVLPPCNHEEADTRVIYHCMMEDKPTVVIASDTDILILMVYAFASRLPTNDWYMQINRDQFVNISKIHDFTGNPVALILPAMFVITGCDTVSYFFRKSKKAVFEKVLKKQELAIECLSDLGVNELISEEAEEKVKRFVQIFVYGLYKNFPR